MEKAVALTQVPSDEDERTIQLALETAEINADLQKSLADDVNFVPDVDDGDGELL